MNKQEQQHLFEGIIEQHKGILFKVARAYCPDEEDLMASDFSKAFLKFKTKFYKI